MILKECSLAALVGIGAFVATSCAYWQPRPPVTKTPVHEKQADGVTDYFIQDAVYKEKAADKGTLDIRIPDNWKPGNPVVLHFHSGGWVSGDKATCGPAEICSDWLDRGFAVIKANYRLAPQYKAPAAVEDAKCALLWIAAHKAQYGFGDIYVSGVSAGGHLALMTALAPGNDSSCEWKVPTPKIAGVIDFYGYTDLVGLDDQFTTQWIPQSRQEKLSAQIMMSPTTFYQNISSNVLIIHGTSDSTINISQSEKLVGLWGTLAYPNITVVLARIPGMNHTNYTPEQDKLQWQAIDRFINIQNGGKTQ